MATNELVKAIPGVPGITGLEYVPGLKKVYTSNWGENKIGVVDLNRMQIVKRLPTREKPNGSTYAEPFGKIYVSDTIAKQEAIVDVHKDAVIKTLTFNSETRTPQYDPVSRKIYINLRSVNQVAAIDPATDTVVGRYPVAGCEYNHGMALDPERRRAFLLCGGNRTFTVFDLEAHKSIAHFPLRAGADVVRFDPGLRRAYAACSSGAITVVQEDSPNRFRKLEDFPVQPSVHSLAVDHIRFYNILRLMADFSTIFAALKRVMAEQEGRLAVQKDTSSEYSLVTKGPSPFPQHRAHPMWFGAVRLGKAYVSFHLMPLYMSPTLKREISPALMKRMQGKTCFNFAAVPDEELLADLKTLTAACAVAWDKQFRRSAMNG